MRSDSYGAPANGIKDETTSSRLVVGWLLYNSQLLSSNQYRI